MSRQPTKVPKSAKEKPENGTSAEAQKEKSKRCPLYQGESGFRRRNLPKRGTSRLAKCKNRRKLKSVNLRHCKLENSGERKWGWSVTTSYKRAHDELVYRVQTERRRFRQKTPAASANGLIRALRERILRKATIPRKCGGFWQEVTTPDPRPGGGGVEEGNHEFADSSITFKDKSKSGFVEKTAIRRRPSDKDRVPETSAEERPKAFRGK